MCSIVVTINETRVDILTSMAEATRHRGPDSFELRLDKNGGAAACRLAIFGEPDAKLIYVDETSGRVILLNGEIYNYKELWKGLNSRNLYPKTDLETELIAALYETFGADFASYLKGMFAIAIVDNDNLVLARDRFGIKPLYYTRKGEAFLVCSEAKGLLEHPDVKPAINRNALEETRVFGYVASQAETLFESIHQVLPGSVMLCDGISQHEVRRFGRLPHARYADEGIVGDYQDCVRKTRELVIQAVQRMFRHGPSQKGIYLSGGLDSSTLTLVASRILGYQIPTFTLTDHPESPDFQAAGQVAKVLGTDHHEYFVTLNDYWRAVPDYLAHYEAIIAGGIFHLQGGVAFHLLSKEVAKTVRVAFSGEGADELFGGYYWAYTHPLGFADRIRNALEAVEHNEELRCAVDALFPKQEDERVYRRNIFDFLLRGGLSNYHLQCVDRSAAAFGFEIRPVFLDDDLSQWAMGLPIEYKVPDKYTTKKILRDAFHEDFQKAGLEWVIQRPKLGMPAAVQQIDHLVTDAVEKAVTDEELHNHPLGRFLGSKLNLLFYDLFEHIFIKGWDHNEPQPPAASILARVWPT